MMSVIQMYYLLHIGIDARVSVARSIVTFVKGMEKYKLKIMMLQPNDQRVNKFSTSDYFIKIVVYFVIFWHKIHPIGAVPLTYLW